MGDFANILDPNLNPGNSQTKYQKKSEDLFNLNFDNNNNNNSKPTLTKTKTAHENQIDAQQEKLKFANEIDPLVKEWSKDPSAGTIKDIRSLLISLKSFLKKFNIEFDKIMLSQVMSKGAVKKMYFKVIRKIHPDKTSETDPKILYMFERITEIISDAFKKHKSMS